MWERYHYPFQYYGEKQTIIFSLKLLLLDIAIYNFFKVLNLTCNSESFFITVFDENVTVSDSLGKLLVPDTPVKSE